jgi:hypothetical protein
MEFLIVVMIVLFVVMALVTVLGHAMWLVCAAVVESLTTSERPQSAPNILSWRCDICNSEVRTSWEYCGTCGAPKPSGSSLHVLKELAVVERFIERLLRENKIGAEIFEALKRVLVAERTNLTTPDRSPVVVAQQEPVASRIREERNRLRRRSIGSTAFQTPLERVVSQAQHHNLNRRGRHADHLPKCSTLSWRRVNIRWGEIIGGLLIIGCSTALVVVMVADLTDTGFEVSDLHNRTAILFGVGMYTEHRWKPDDESGIPTIATLLVPLDFLAIAAVSSGDSGRAVLASELLAPAIFLCLVYFAGRIIAGCALIVAGVLGSPVVNFWSDTLPPAMRRLVFRSYSERFRLFVTSSLCVGAASFLADRKIDETETTTVLRSSHDVEFAALLPFGLLLYKSGPLAMSMMYLARSSHFGAPMLATGTRLMATNRQQRTGCFANRRNHLGILGLMIALAGMIPAG